MTPAQRLRSVLTPRLISLGRRLLRAYCRREAIRPNHFLADEVESSAFLGVATVLDAISKGANPDNPIAYAAAAINREMRRACMEDARQPRCHFSDEYGPDQIIDHIPDGGEVDLLDRYCTDDTDREMIALYASGQYVTHRQIADALGKDPKTIYRRIQNIRRLASA